MVKEYSAKHDLGLEDMSPTSWHSYVKRLSRNQTEFDTFRQHYYRNGPAEAHHPCHDRKCKENLLCSLLTSEAQLVNQPQVCKELKERSSNAWWNSFWQ